MNEPKMKDTGQPCSFLLQLVAIEMIANFIGIFPGVQELVCGKKRIAAKQNF
jgi:hypothetical protein